MNIKRHILVWAGAATLIALSAALGLWSGKMVGESAGWQAHTLQVINKEETLLADLTRAETGQRGYLITGDERFLEPYRQFANSLPQQLLELRTLTADQPAQRPRLDKVQTLIEERMAVLQTGIELRRQGNEEGARGLVSNGRGPALMSHIREVMRTFEQHENRLLHERTARLASDIRFLTLGVALSAFFAVFLLALALLRVAKLHAEAQKRATFQATLLDNIESAIISTDPDGRVTSLNRGAEQLLGCSPKAIGQTVPAIVHVPENTPNGESGAVSAPSRGGSISVGELISRAGETRIDSREWSLETQDGQRRPVSLTLSAMRDPGGRLSGYLLILRDITARKEAEAEAARVLKELTEFKSALDEHAIVATTDASGTITYANNKFCTISKYARAELLGQNHRLVNSGFHSPEFFQSLWDTISSGRVWKGEIRNRAKDGSYYWVNTTIVPFLDPNGLPHQYIAIRTDITARKEAELALAQAKNAAELANRTKDSFLATMSHEIRTPLGGLLGMLELLGFTPLTEEQRDTLRAAQESGRSLLRIVNDILDWSKIEAGKLELAPQPTAIRQLMATVANTYARVASAKSLVLEYRVDERLAPAYTVDPLRLAQILNNFVSNALKFTTHGRVEIGAALSEREELGDRLRLSVKDTGVGISEEVRQKLFQDFAQGSASTARLYGGTGLGLAICRRLAEMMDGTISVESAPGVGSTFALTITLPRSDTLPDPTAETIDANDTSPFRFPMLGAAPAQPPLVLVVDDHPTNRKLLAIQVGLLGLRAETAENGEKALSMWSKGHYAAVITDCHMPRMDGYELARLIREHEVRLNLPPTPIIGWTANALPEEAARCNAAGMNELLVKPATLAHLKKCLAAWIVTATASEADAIPAPSEQPSAIDYNELQKIAPDPADQREVVREFISQCETDFDALRSAADAGDILCATRVVHRMKGASRMVGARELTAVCMQLEAAAMKQKALDIAGLRTTLDRLREHISSVHGESEGQ